MKGSFSSFIRIGLGLATFSAAVALRADETATQVVEAAQASLAGVAHGELTATSRRVMVIQGREAEAREPGDVPTQRLSVTWRAPGDWRLVYRREGGAATGGGVSYVFSKAGEVAGMLTVDSTDNERVPVTLPPKIFFQEARQRIGSMMSLPALALIPNWPTRPGVPAEAATLIDNPVVKGDGLVGGWSCRRIDGVKPQTRLSLWIDKETNRLMRSREVRDLREGMGPGRMVTVVETVYSYAAEKGAKSEDFDLQAGWALAGRSQGEIEGFGSMAELSAWVREGWTSETGGSAGSGGSPGSNQTNPGPSLRPGGAPVAGAPYSGQTPPAASNPSASIEAQSLNADQMAAIVLVEGEDGVGTGFLTKIRELPFVVTNLHVIGGSEKLRVTTLTGAKIEVGAIHGAIGRDLAILRVEGAAPAAFLKLSADPLQTAKIGDKVVVVGNRRGGGVATQVSGSVQGIGPDRVEVNAPFQPGNSGSPIVHVESGEVIGLAAYSQTRKLDVLDGAPAKASGSKEGDEPKVEQRWFGYRIDGVAGWQAIDLARWRQQARRIEVFREESEALYYALLGRFPQTGGSPGVQRVVERFQERFERSGTAQVQVMQDVAEYFRSLRALTDNGKKELREGDYYDYFRSSLYWETSIPEQLRMREQIAKYLDKAADNSTAFLSRLRN